LETIFLRKFGENKTPTTLVLELSGIKMDAKELVNDYNRCFLSLLRQILRASNPTEDVSIEFYTSSLHISMAIFVNNVEKSTLEEAFQEALKVEKNMMSLKGNPGEESSKYKGKSKATMSKPS
jgi:hypothetical protein